MRSFLALFLLFCLISIMQAAGSELQTKLRQLNFDFPDKAIGWLYENTDGRGVFILAMSATHLADAAGKFTLRIDPDRTALSCNNRALNDPSWLKKLPKDSIKTIAFNNTKIDDNWIANLEQLSWLRGLQLSGTNISDGGLKFVAKLKGLQALNLGHSKITGTGLHYLATLSKLEDLNLEYCLLDSHNLSDLGKLASLKRLSLDSIETLDETNYQFLTRLTKLTVLDLKQTKIGDKAIQEVIPCLPELTQLNVGGTALTDRGFKIICKSKKLEFLEAQGCDLKNLNQITLPKKLKWLKLPRIRAVNDRFVHDADLSRMTYLNFGYTLLSKNSLKKLSQIKHLENLYLNGIDLSSADVELLGQISPLRGLFLESCKLSSKQLQFCEKLKLNELDIANNPIDDSALPILQNCKSLKYLSLSHTSLTKGAVERLRESLPKAKVEHQSF